MPTRVIIAGGRDFDDYDLLKEECDKYLSPLEKPIIIISGGAKGADTHGETYAKWRNYTVEKFIPNWNLHGKAAGPIRNSEMARWANYLIAFWDGESRGTLDMIEKMKKEGKTHQVIFY